MNPSSFERNRWITWALEQQVFFKAAERGITGKAILWSEFLAWCDCWNPSPEDHLRIWCEVLSEYVTACEFLELTTK